MHGSARPIFPLQTLHLRKLAHNANNATCSLQIKPDWKGIPGLVQVWFPKVKITQVTTKKMHRMTTKEVVVIGAVAS
jgi:hypothetical protein